MSRRKKPKRSPEPPRSDDEVTTDPITAPPPQVPRPPWTLKVTAIPNNPPNVTHHGPATSNGKANIGTGGMGIPKHQVDAEVVGMSESTRDDSPLIELRFPDPAGPDPEPKPSPGPQLVRVICPECSTSFRARLMDLRLSTNRKTQCLRCSHQFIIPEDVTTITPPPLPPLQSVRTFVVDEYVEGPAPRPFKLDIPPQPRRKPWIQWMLMVPAAGLIVLGLYNQWGLTVDSPTPPSTHSTVEPIEFVEEPTSFVPIINHSFSRVTGPPTEHH